MFSYSFSVVHACEEYGVGVCALGRGRQWKIKLSHASYYKDTNLIWSRPHPYKLISSLLPLFKLSLQIQPHWRIGLHVRTFGGHKYFVHTTIRHSRQWYFNSRDGEGTWMEVRCPCYTQSGITLIPTGCNNSHMQLLRKLQKAMLARTLPTNQSGILKQCLSNLQKDKEKKKEWETDETKIMTDLSLEVLI